MTTYYYRVAAPPRGAGRTLLVDGSDDLLLNTAVISNVAPDTRHRATR